MTQHKKTPASLFPATLPVRLVDGQPRTTSLDIARHFDKNHQHVLRDIRDIVRRMKDPGRLPNFGESSYLNEQGKAQPMYLLNRDAFVFVVGGFTGARADACKWQFIDAFNALEDFGFAQSAEGTAQMVVFGDAWVQDWCVVGVGNYRTQPVRR